MSASPSARQALRFGRFRLDPARGELRKDEHPVKLQPQPLRVLALLASRAGELVTRDEIKKELWSEDTFVDFEHGINFCINQIRTALGDDPEKPQFVQTVPRKGYRFLASVEALGAATDGSEPVAPKRRWRKPALVAAIVLVLLGSVWALWQLRAPTTDSAAPSIAVLHFDNLTGDAELDWLRTGLTDMLVTDLSQSPNLTVLSIDRLFQILSDLDRLEDPVTSFETVREVAERANTDTVVLGSFMKAGDNIRINVRIQDAPSGEILTTEKVEGVGQESIFSMVDDLTRRIRARFDIPSAAGETGFDRGIEEITTSSVEAYRYHIEARRLHLQAINRSPSRSMRKP